MNLETIIALLKNMPSDSIDQVIAAAQDELYGRADEEQAKQDYDDLLARQYAYDRLHGRTNALQGIK